MVKDIGQRGNAGAVFRNGTMDFGAAWLLGYAQQGGLSPGTLLQCFASIKDGDPNSWELVFVACAKAVEARAADSAGWSAAQVAWRASLFLADPKAPATAAAARSMKVAFARSVAAGSASLEEWSIPFGQASLPAWVSRRIADTPRAVLIVGGGDTYVEDLWFFGGRALIEQGWAVVMVDLPGQGVTPQQGLYFGKSTLDGLFAVLDAMHARGFSGELILLGWSGGGIFTTKYASLARPEDHLVALVASTPVHDVRSMFEHALPRVLRGGTRSPLLRMALALVRRNRVMAAALAKYDWQFGPAGMAGALDAVDPSLAKTDLSAIDVPVLALVGAAEDPELQRQAKDVISAVVARHPASRVETFDAISGGAAHCQVGNLPDAMSRVTSWLSEVVDR